MLKGDKIRQYYKNKRKAEIISQRKNIQTTQINNYYKDNTEQNTVITHYYKIRHEDIINRIIGNLASRFYNASKKYGFTKDVTHLQLIGCSKETLRNHISSLFSTNMTFDNYGEWELDHIIPISSFNFTNVDNIKKCFNYTNIQPLWQNNNRCKSDKIAVICERSELYAQA